MESGKLQHLHERNITYWQALHCVLKPASIYSLPYSHFDLLFVNQMQQENSKCRTFMDPLNCILPVPNLVWYAFMSLYAIFSENVLLVLQLLV